MAAGDSKPAPGRTPPIYRDSTVISRLATSLPPTQARWQGNRQPTGHGLLRAPGRQHPRPGGLTQEKRMDRLAGKTALITGGEGSIGMATARALAAEGASVFLAGISEPGLKAGAAELGGRA